jgi:hypothetical protein
MQPFSLNQTGTLLRRHLAHFVSAIDKRFAAEMIIIQSKRYKYLIYNDFI